MDRDIRKIPAAKPMFSRSPRPNMLLSTSPYVCRHQNFVDIWCRSWDMPFASFFQVRHLVFQVLEGDIGCWKYVNWVGRPHLRRNRRRNCFNILYISIIIFTAICGYFSTWKNSFPGPVKWWKELYCWLNRQKCQILFPIKCRRLCEKIPNR